MIKKEEWRDFWSWSGSGFWILNSKFLQLLLFFFCMWLLVNRFLASGGGRYSLAELFHSVNHSITLEWFPCGHFTHSASRKGKESWEWDDVTGSSEEVLEMVQRLSDGALVGGKCWVKPVWHMRKPWRGVGKEASLICHLTHFLFRPECCCRSALPTGKRSVKFPCWLGVVVVVVGRFILGGSSFPDASQQTGKSR